MNKEESSMITTTAAAPSTTTDTNNTQPSTSITTNTTTTIQPPPKLYQNQTLEQILNTISQNLETHTTTFLSQAQRIAEQDAVLRESQRSIYNLATEVSKLYIQHEDLDLKLNQIDDVYRNTDCVLDTLEKQVDVLFQHSMMGKNMIGGSDSITSTDGNNGNHDLKSSSGGGGGNNFGTGGGGAVIDDSDIERERYYNLAIEVDGKLNRINDEVGDLEKMLEGIMMNSEGLSADSVNLGVDGITSSANTTTDGSIVYMIKVMNRQKKMMDGLEASCEKLENELNLATRVA